jgi:hypothetical protein
VAEIAQWSTFFTLFGALLVKVSVEGTDTSVFGYLLCSVNAMIFVTTLLVAAYEIREMRETLGQSLGVLKDVLIRDCWCCWCCCWTFSCCCRKKIHGELEEESDSGDGRGALVKNPIQSEGKGGEGEAPYDGEPLPYAEPDQSHRGSDDTPPRSGEEGRASSVGAPMAVDLRTEEGERELDGDRVALEPSAEMEATDDLAAQR